MQYGEHVAGRTIRTLTIHGSASRELGLEGLQDHSGLHVLRHSGVAEVGVARGRGTQADQVRVSSPRFRMYRDRFTHLDVHRYDHGITTFDTANVHAS